MIKKYDKAVDAIKDIDERTGKKLILRATLTCRVCGSDLVAMDIRDDGYSEEATTFIFTCPNKRWWNFHNTKEHLYLPFVSYAKVLANWG